MFLLSWTYNIKKQCQHGILWVRAILPEQEGKSLQSKGEWMDNESNIVASKRYQKGFQCKCKTFSKSAIIFLSSPTFPLLYSYLGFF